MAYQSKKHRKFVAAAATATLVASAVAPAALAAETAATKNFSDVANHWGKEAIDYLVNKGVLDGYPNGTFQPDGDITRAEVAKVLAVTLELEVDEAAKASFADSEDHWASAYIAAIEGQLDGVINGFEDGTFRPDANISRQDMAKMIVAAYDLEANNDVDVEFNDSASYAEAQAAIEILASLGVVQGQSEGVFAPAAEVTRAETATFVLRSEVPAKRVLPVQGELEITSVSSLTEDGHVLEVQFSRPMSSFSKTDVVLHETSSNARVGVESVDLATDGMSAQINLFDNTSDAFAYEVKRGVEYTLTIGTLTTEFTRPNFLDDRRDARVTEIDMENNDFTVTYDEGETVTIEVPGSVEFDYEAAVGMEIRVWYSGDEELIDYELINTDEVYFDAFEVSEDDGEIEIELQTADETFELATDKETDDITTKYYLNGSDQGNINSVDDLADADYAKVILDDKGDIAYIYAYSLEELIVVDSVDGTVVEGLGDNDVDLEDYVIVKDGKTIQVSDLEAGDAVYLSKGAKNSLGEEGYAVVYNNTITGEIETIYDDSFVVEGTKYKYETISYLDEDGEIEDEFTKDEAEDFESEEVTIFVDFNGDVQLLTGEQVDAGNEVGVLLTETADVNSDYNDSFDVSVELEYVTEDGEENAEEVSFDSLDSITVDGKEYDVEQDEDENEDSIIIKTGDNTFGITDNDSDDGYVENEDGELEVNLDDVVEIELTDNTPINLTFDDNGAITDLEIFTEDSLEDNADIEPGDSYAELESGDKKLKNDTVVFVADEGPDTDSEDVEAYRFADIDFDIDSDTAEVYYNEDGDVEFVVVEDTVAADTTDHIAVVDGYSTTDDEVTRLVAYVNGTKTTYTVDKVDLGTADDVKAILADGNVVKISVNDETGDVDDIFAPVYGDEDFNEDYFLLNQEDAEDVTSSKFTLGTTEYRKGDNFQIIDATERGDLETETSLSSIEDKKFHVILEAEGSRYVDTIVIIGDDEASNDHNYDEALAISNNAPTVDSAIADAQLVVDEEATYSVADTFADADNDDLVITVSDDDANDAVATVTFADENITVVGQAEGTVTITVKAEDGFGGSVTDTFDVTVTEVPDTATVTVVADDTFVVADDNVATAAVDADDNTSLVVTAVAEGTTTLTVTSNGTDTVYDVTVDADGNITVTAQEL